MKIESSNLHMQSTSLYLEEITKEEQFRAWEDKPMQIPKGDGIDISVEGLEAQKAGALAPKEDEMLADEEQLKLKLIEAMLSKLTGKKFKFRYVTLNLREREKQIEFNKELQKFEAAGTRTAQGNGRLGWGIDYHYREQYLEQEQMSFKADGQVSLKDGRKIDFSVSLNMSRSYYEEFSMDTKAGDALKDPLVLDIAGKGIGFTDKTMNFDLDIDGTKDVIPVLAEGSGYLVIDRNNNQIMDDGSELFGPRTDRGFEELSQFDKDNNGWIDENDEVFKSLKIWLSDGEGNGQLIGLVEAGVGAIYLGNANTAFSFKDGQNDTLGKLRQTGVYLKENGQAGIIHEVDIKI